MTGRLDLRFLTSALPLGEGRGEGAPRPHRLPPHIHAARAFTLVELLVSASVVLMLMTLVGGAVSAARGSTRRNATVAAITRLDDVLMAQFRRYSSRSVEMPDSLPTGMTRSSYRAWHIRRSMITADMPDRWSDVAFMADPANASRFTSVIQRSYIATWNAAVAKKTPTNQFAGAECLFMIVMQGGFADCLDCESLRTLKKGDKDGDGMFEFWDGWDDPIGYILWAPAYEISGSQSLFFSGDRQVDMNPFPATGTVRPTLGMRPLIYSGGPDKQYGLERFDEARTLDLGTGPVGRDCGNPSGPHAGAGGPSVSGGGGRDDNITNLDLEAKS